MSDFEMSEMRDLGVKVLAVKGTEMVFCNGMARLTQCIPTSSRSVASLCWWEEGYACRVASVDATGAQAGVGALTCAKRPESVRLSSREKCLGQPHTRNVIWAAVRANED
jgi:hypothetical protein